MPLQATSGAASYDGFGGGVAAVPTYIEDVFSTYLYTGNGSTQTITNGIDLSTKGGLVWTKGRSAITDNMWFDTARGVQKELSSNKTNAEATNTLGITAFGTTGYSMGSDGSLNGSGTTYASWTFRKQPKFFDVVTFTSNSSGGATFSHNLGATPAFVIVKCTSTTESWWAWSDTFTSTQYITLNLTNAKQTGTAAITVSSTQVTLGNGWLINNNASYVAYLFASNAGGFGLTGTDNVISCGSYTAVNGTSLNVNLGFEPQWLLVKKTNSTGDWWLQDNMRGFTAVSVSDGSVYLKANSSAAESIKSTTNDALILTSTGFTVPATSGDFNSNGSYIYIAIRRGPMKVPTSGTSVFDANSTAFSVASLESVNFPIDFSLAKSIYSSSSSFRVTDRLRGFSDLNTASSTLNLLTPSTAAEVATYPTIYQVWNNSWRVGEQYGGTSSIYYGLRRAPSFFDEVCYTGIGAPKNVSHNLGVVPEMIITKSRGPSSGNWGCYHSFLGATKGIDINSNGASFTASTMWNDTSPTISVFTVNTANETGTSGANYVAYLFATCPGVSKVGSYTGTGTTLQVNCGFTGGARFVLIKRTDSTGDWYVWDSARGIVAGNDPYLLLNSTAAEVTSTDYIDTYSAGFEISSTAPAAINASGGTFIFLAIA